MKRFTCTEKWNDPWFLDLEPTLKLLWLWLCDKCDNAGVLDISWRKASFELGAEVTEDHAAKLGDRLQKLPTGKWFLPKFIAFQQRTLSPGKASHRQIINLCNNHGIPIPSLCDEDGMPMPSGKGNGQGLVNVKEGSVRGVAKMPDDEWLKLIASKYPGVDIEAELRRMDAWFLTPRGQGRQKTRQFIVNWLNRCDRLMASTPGAQQQRPARPTSIWEANEIIKTCEEELKAHRESDQYKKYEEDGLIPRGYTEEGKKIMEELKARIAAAKQIKLGAGVAQ